MSYELFLSARARDLMDQLDPPLRQSAIEQLSDGLPTDRDLVTVERLQSGDEYWVSMLPGGRLEVAYGPVGDNRDPVKLVLYAIRAIEATSSRPSSSSARAEGSDHE